MTRTPLTVKCFEFGPFGTNTYVVSFSLPAEEGRGEVFVLLIDPACSNQHEQQVLYDYINSVYQSAGRSNSATVCQQSGLSAEGGLIILATHGHLDHLWGAPWACEQWHTPALMHPADIPMAQDMQAQYDLFGIRATPQPFPIEPLDISSPLWGGRVGLLPSPGHTPGSICLYCEQEKLLFSGDTLFRMGYGRTDLPGGDINQLIHSLQTLFALSPDTRVFPGHGEFTTIGAEKRS